MAFTHLNINTLYMSMQLYIYKTILYNRLHTFIHKQKNYIFIHLYIIHNNTFILKQTSKILFQINTDYLSLLPLPLLLLPEALPGPSNLQFTGSTTDSLRFRWSPAGGQVTGYLIQYTPISGLGQPISTELRQVRPLNCN